jgi:hypothetical protein
VKNDVVFDAEKSLRTNAARLTEFAALTIALIQRNGETIEVRATGDLAQNQIRAWEIGQHQSWPPLSTVGSRKGNDNDFAGYRFDHAASSSGEFQSRARTDSLSSAPLNASSTAFDATSLSVESGVLITNCQTLKRFRKLETGIRFVLTNPADTSMLDETAPASEPDWH